ncbi:MAG TPA: hypothetical protein VLQ90_00520 [Pyrinomonadaceae bacterium]|nr:hypothetical protein [Pyrinomonadaceae bacterium]
MRSPNLAPSQDPVHLVLCDYGKLGNAYAETPPVCTERDAVEGILKGEYNNPLEVVAFDVSEGWSRDVSEDVAGAVVERARSEQRKLGEGARRFVEKHLDEELEPELCT